MITLTTNYGDIQISLDSDKAPASSENFVRYCKEGFYEGTLFHRIIDGFMIQGGGYSLHSDGFAVNMVEKETHAPITNEANRGLKNLTGTIAMARTDAPHSATAQFFINLADNDFLDHTAPTNKGWGYTVFGKVTMGMDVVTAIGKIPTCTRFGHEDIPVEDVVIEKVTVK